MKKILIIEDAPLNTELLVQLLEDDYQLLVAEDGVVGVELTHRELPDLIIMDMSLPIMDGWEATRQIKADASTSHIPVIGLSAHAMSGDDEKAFAAGCDDYLTKPVDFNRLYEALDRHLNG
ncbi:MAG: response regulator [Chloroflexi bacterium]|nr:response regulator [Chloroflexota bacterium]